MALAKAKYTPPQLSIYERIKNMKPQTSIIIEGAKLNSVRSTASQVAAADDSVRRMHRSAKIGRNVQVWRDQ